jgi:hypothetical protein
MPDVCLRPLQETTAELCGMVHSLQKKLNGGAMLLRIVHVSIIIPSKARTQNESIENQRYAYNFSKEKK